MFTRESVTGSEFAAVTGSASHWALLSLSLSLSISSPGLGTKQNDQPGYPSGCHQPPTARQDQITTTIHPFRQLCQSESGSLEKWLKLATQNKGTGDVQTETEADQRAGTSQMTFDSSCNVSNPSPHISDVKLAIPPCSLSPHQSAPGLPSLLVSPFFV
ncbi:hypothetical protein LX36DRAFT_116807 [Colletotrichum falcatum]|nr:hypothetical protein LX36DRAFT_116807 [Colletotrichum falcatum]